MRLRFYIATLLALLLIGRSFAATALVFNEVMYHPAVNEPTNEWVELYNQLAVDLDVSGWSLGGDLSYKFAPNTRVPGRSFIVVAINPAELMAATGLTNVYGPLTNRLSNNGGTLEIRNNSGRLLDRVNYGVDGDWPVAPDGSGVSLAKRDRDFGSADARNWTVSAQIGGTPGADNFAIVSNVRLIAVDAAWKYEASGTDLGTLWRDANYADGGWSSRYSVTNRTIPGLFNTGVGTNGSVVADGGADPHYILSYAAQGPVGANATVTLNHSAWAANDAVSKWISVVNPGTTSINGGGYGYQTTFSLAGFLPSTVQLNFSVAIDNAMTNVFLNGASLGFAFAGFDAFSSPFTVNSGLLSGTNTLEFGTENQGAGPGAFRATLSGTGLAANTNSPLPTGYTTYYFRKNFNFFGNPQYSTLTFNPVLADGAVFYLNGVEVYRQNMPAGPVSYSTPALSNVSSLAYSGPITISAGNLIAGNNVLAVEVHQAASSPDGPLFGTDLSYSTLPVPPVPLVFNELSGTTNTTFWLELKNYGSNTMTLDGYVIRYDGTNDADYVLPSGTTLGAGQFLTLTNTTLGFTPLSGDKLFLFAPNFTAVHDAVVTKKGPRARHPDGTGQWLAPNASTPGANNSFVFHNEIVINEIMYHHIALPPVSANVPPKNNPEAWIELYNRSSNTVDLSDWELGGGVSFKFKAGRTIAPGAYLLVADDDAALSAAYPSLDIVGNLGGKLSRGNDHIVLKDPLGNPADDVHYYGGGRWPAYPDGGGSSLELRDPNSDNSKGEAWGASDESSQSSWQFYTYRMVANIPSGSGQPTQWNDFILGLLDAGECLIDDISVIESPASSAVQFVANGNFENGLAGWRVLGTHGHSEVIVDPDSPGNHVLHVIATGYQEHMHNHIESTYTGNRSVTAGREYQISFRAKWLAGNNLLNTRLYFNRVPRTTPLPYPQRNGTPGERNSRYVPNIGPTFSEFGHQSVVPSAGEPVMVTVNAEDPQDVASTRVYWSVNSGAWNNAAMTPGSGGRYTGTIPGQIAGAVVQFYVQATDGLGATATYPANGANSGAIYKVNDGQADVALAHNVRIILTPANIDLLHGTAQGVNQTNVMSNDLLPCTVVYDERLVYYDCGVHLRGSQRGRYSDIRTGFHIEFPPYDLFKGVHPTMLIDRSGAGDATANRQEEIVLKHILNSAGGIPGTYSEICRLLAPRSAHTGPAQFFPRHEDVFIETAFEDGGDGTMFEMELIYFPTSANGAGYKLPQPDQVIGTDVTNLGDDKEIYRYNFLIKNHRDVDDYSRFVALGKAWALSGAALDAQTRQLMDIDEWMRAYALVSLCSVGDMYTFGNNHNFFMYVRPSDGKFLYFPWDMDFAFNRGASGALVGDQNLSKIVNLPGNLRLLYGHMLDIINVSFNANYMAYWTAHYAKFAPGQSYAGSLSTIAARVPYVIGVINTAGGNAAFAVNGASSIMTGSNLVTLTGTAPVTMTTITINGVAYPITWSSISAWTMTFPVSSRTNEIIVEGRDRSGAVVTNLARTVVFTNTLPDPRGIIVFNEIMYNPSFPDAAYVELFNKSSNASFDLSGWRINGLDFTFPPGKIITPNQYVVIAGNAAAYAGAYGVAGGVAVGEFLSGNLQNDGETLTLIKPAATSNEVDLVIDRVRYEAVAPWSTNANGTGSSLQLIDPLQENARVGNWFSSYVPPVYSEPIATPPQIFDGWRFVSVTGSAGAGAGGQQMRLVINLGVGEINEASALIDDVSIVTGTNAAVGYNFVRNGDFETGPLLEVPALTNSWYIGTNYTNTAIIGGLTHGGNGALRMACQTFGNAFPRVISQLLSPAPQTNAIHTLSFWYWATNTATNLNVKLLQSGPLNVVTNINIFIIPSNYIPPTLISPATNSLSPGAANQQTVTLPPFGPLWINEVQAENATGLVDSRGEHDPWIEIYNPSTNTVGLEGLYLASSYTNLTDWAFPAGSSIGPTQFLVVFCDGQSAQTSNTEYHTSFRLPPASGAIALARLYSNGPAVLNGPQVLDYVNYAGLHADRSYGSFPDGQPFERREFFYVTPGGTNDGRSAPLQVFINEWMASNTNALADPADGDYDDWFELYNPGPNTVDLAGYYLSDSSTNGLGVVTNKFKYLITTNGPHTIPPGGHLLVWADNETGQNTSGGVPRPDLHVNFQLAKAGEALGLFAADGAQIDFITFANQLDDVSAGRYPDGTATIVAMPGTASPGAPNYLAGSSNTAPVLDPIGPKVLYLGETLTFTATASDADLPAQVLTFTLIGAPPGATIGLGTGHFTWTPANAGTNTLTVRVSDNGGPVKSDDETITVTVLTGPLTRSVRQGQNLELTWGTVPGKKYAVDTKPDLNAASWQPLQTNLAPGLSLSYTNSTTNSPHRFFRIRIVE